MEKRRLKELVQELEELLAELKVEVYADVEAYKLDDGYRYEYDDDGYPD